MRKYVLSRSCVGRERISSTGLWGLRRFATRKDVLFSRKTEPKAGRLCIRESIVRPAIRVVTTSPVFLSWVRLPLLCGANENGGGMRTRIVFNESALAPRRRLPLIGLRLNPIAHPFIPIAQEHQSWSYMSRTSNNCSRYRVVCRRTCKERSVGVKQGKDGLSS